VFYPKVANQQYGVLAELVGIPELALIGTCNIKHNEHLVRLDRWQNLLIVQTLLYPEDLNETDAPPIEFSKDFMETMLEFAAKSVKEFNSEDYRNGVAERVAALTAAIESGEPAPAIERKSSDDMALEQLKAWLEQGEKVDA
jgi:non-homologous end joining protein Ku